MRTGERYVLYEGDCLDVMATLPADSVDAIVTDPPYGIEFMQRSWDSFNPRAPKTTSERGTHMNSGAFPGTGYDGKPRPVYPARKSPKNEKCLTCGKWRVSSNRCRCDSPRFEYTFRREAPPQMLAFEAFCVAWAEEAYRVAKPGAHLVAFGGPRTFHRLTCAIEDAGWEIRDGLALFQDIEPELAELLAELNADQAQRLLAMLGRVGAPMLAWVYGSGFPKSLDVGKAIDKAAGAEREVVQRVTRRDIRNGPGKVRGSGIHAGERQQPTYIEHAITLPATDAARRWQGWGTGLKPAWEPIVLARKPFGRSVAAHVQEHSTGALNIDACKIGAEAVSPHGLRTGTGPTVLGAKSPEGYAGNVHVGRWPANLVLDDAAAALLDELADACGASIGQDVSTHEYTRHNQVYGTDARVHAPFGYDKRGGASRFFFVAKASRSEREAGCEQLPSRLGGSNAKGYTEDVARGLDRNRPVKNHHPCLPPGELVLTERGYRPIESVRIGDRVYSGDGTWRPVTDAFASPCESEIVTVAVDSTTQTLRATTNHPFLVWEVQRQSGALVGGEVKWKAAGDLAVGDYTLTPIADRGTMSYDAERAWAFGLWVAEGSLQRAGHGANCYPVWTLHADETAYIERLRRVFGSVAVYETPARAVHVMAFDASAGAEFARLGGIGARRKCLSPDVLTWNHGARVAVVQGYLAGDGSIARGEHRAKTASADLAATMMLLAESVGYHVARYQTHPTGTARIGDREFPRGPYWMLVARNGRRLARPRFVEHEGHCHSVRRIKRIDRTPYTGPVWNITVEGTHTYQTPVGLTHNTVKPLSLVAWLCRLVTPPGGVILDPFVGSGTTPSAAVASGFRCIGIELDRDNDGNPAGYLDIAEARTRYWATRGLGTDREREIAKVLPHATAHRFTPQLGLEFDGAHPHDGVRETA